MSARPGKKKTSQFNGRVISCFPENRCFRHHLKIASTVAGASHCFHPMISSARNSTNVVHTNSPVVGPYKNARYHRQILVF